MNTVNAEQQIHDPQVHHVQFKELSFNGKFHFIISKLILFLNRIQNYVITSIIRLMIYVLCRDSSQPEGNSNNNIDTIEQLGLLEHTDQLLQAHFSQHFERMKSCWHPINQYRTVVTFGVMLDKSYDVYYEGFKALCDLIEKNKIPGITSEDKKRVYMFKKVIKRRNSIRLSNISTSAIENMYNIFVKCMNYAIKNNLESTSCISKFGVVFLENYEKDRIKGRDVENIRKSDNFVLLLRAFSSNILKWNPMNFYGQPRFQSYDYSQKCHSTHIAISVLAEGILTGMNTERMKYDYLFYMMARAEDIYRIMLEHNKFVKDCFKCGDISNPIKGFWLINPALLTVIKEIKTKGKYQLKYVEDYVNLMGAACNFGIVDTVTSNAFKELVSGTNYNKDQFIAEMALVGINDDKINIMLNEITSFVASIPKHFGPNEVFKAVSIERYMFMLRIACDFGFIGPEKLREIEDMIYIYNVTEKAGFIKILLRLGINKEKMDKIEDFIINFVNVVRFDTSNTCLPIDYLFNS